MYLKSILKSKIFLFIVVFILVFLTRFIGDFHGYPYSWHPDEWRIVLETLSMAQNHSILTASPNYPLLFRYIILSIYAIWYLIGLLFKSFSSPTDFALLFFAKPYLFLIIPRIINSIVGTFIILFGYYFCKKLFSKLVALITFCFLFLEHQLLVHSQVGVHEEIASATTLPVFYTLFLYLKKPTNKNLLYFSLAIGLSASIHQTTILFLPIIAFCLIYQIIKRQLTFVNFTKFVLVTGIISLIGNLEWIFRFQLSWNFILFGNQVSKTAFSAVQSLSHTIPSFIFWFFTQLVIQNYILGVLMILSIFFALWRHRLHDLIYLIYFFTYCIFYYNWNYRYLHLHLGLLPIMVIYSALLLEQIFKHFQIKRNSYQFLIILLILLPNIYSYFWTTRLRLLPDTLNLAKSWIENNISPGKNIALDWPSYNVLLNSTPPSFLLNIEGKKYFNQKIPIEIKNKLSQISPQYNLIDAMYNSPRPIWPTNMPQNLIKQAENSLVYQNMYSYFNFLSLDEVNQKSDYLIISSYSYSMYLYDDDIRKKDLFNIYLKDDVSSFYSQGKSNQSKIDNPLVYYVAKRGREFYLPLLDNNSSKFTEIKRFTPSNNIFGPTVIIYGSNK